MTGEEAVRRYAGPGENHPERDVYVISARTQHEAARLAAELNLWLHSWSWEAGDGEPTLRRSP